MSEIRGRFGQAMEKTKSENKFFTLIKFGSLGNGTASQAFVLWTAVLIWNHFVLSGVMAVIMAAISWSRKEFREAILAEKPFLILNIAITGVSMLSSVISGNIVGMAISAGVFFLLSIFSCLKGVMTKESFEKFTVFVCIGSIVAFVAAVVQKFIIYRTDLYRPTAGAFNANYYGALIVMAAILAMVNLLDGDFTVKNHLWYRPTKIFYAVVLVINCAALLLSESRSSLLAFMACVLIYLYMSGRYVLCSVFAVLGGGMWLLGWFYPDVFSWTNSLSFIFTERMKIWECAFGSYLGSVRSILIGRGPMTYDMVWESEGLFDANHAHNLVIDSLINVGIIGTLIYGIIIAAIIRTAHNARRRGNTFVYLLIMTFVAEVFVQGFADVTIMWHQSAALFLAVAAASGIKQKDDALHNGNFS